MYEPKKIIVVTGHFGSGKTNFSTALALSLAAQGKPVTVVDFDLVNPYFRTADFKEAFARHGITLRAPDYANTNVDIPSVQFDLGGLAAEDGFLIIDVGGDEDGAVALGRYTPEILEEGNYEMIFVANAFRPLTRKPEEALEVMREIEAAGGIPFTAIVNNANLGEETSAEDVLRGEAFCRELSRLSGLPVAFTSIVRELQPHLEGKVGNLFPMQLQYKYYA